MTSATPRVAPPIRLVDSLAAARGVAFAPAPSPGLPVRSTPFGWPLARPGLNPSRLRPPGFPLILRPSGLRLLRKQTPGYPPLCLTPSISMATYLIRHRWTRRELAAIEAPSYARALEWAARCGMSLIDVDLSGTVLRGAFLAGADLRGAGLHWRRPLGLLSPQGRPPRGRPSRCSPGPCFPGRSRPPPVRTSARRTSSRADLRGTQPAGCRPPRHDPHRLPASAMRYATGDGAPSPRSCSASNMATSAEGSRLVVDMAFHDDSGPWSWLKLLFGYGCLADWALGILAGWVRDGDNAPDLLRYLTSDARNGRHRSLTARWRPDMSPNRRLPGLGPII